MADSRWWADRESTRPLRVDGGIKARSRRGPIGLTWWSARFLQVLEAIGVGGRLDRGRAYARAGQVLSLRIDPGSVRAQVQGSRPRPYQARIGITTFGKREWARIEQAMADSAWYAAKLLAGEMPPDIEEVFASVGVTLFPAGIRELAMDCSCPDPEVPCKHLAATCYLLAESFDDDPFGMLALRGRDRETLLANIRARRDPPDPAGSSVVPTESPERFARPLAECLDDYFRPAGELPALPVSAVAVDALLDQLPDPGLTVRGRPLVELLRPAYRALGEDG